MKRVIFSLLLMLLLAACATTKIAVLKTTEVKFSRYSRVEIPDFSVKTSLIVPKEVLQAIPDQIAAQLTKEQLFTYIMRHSTPCQERVLVIKGVVTQYKPGSRLKRGLTFGIGQVGAGFVIVRITFFDKESNQKIAALDVKGQVNWGITGGSLRTCYKTIAKEVVNFIKFYY